MQVSFTFLLVSPHEINLELEKQQEAKVFLIYVCRRFYLSLSFSVCVFRTASHAAACLLIY